MVSQNITVALLRITDLRNLLADKGVALGLKYDNLPLLGNGNDTLEKVVNTFKSIQKRTPNALIEITANLKFLAGYYPEDFTIAVSGGAINDQLDELLKNIASPDKVLSTGKTLQKKGDIWEEVQGTITLHDENTSTTIGSVDVTNAGETTKYLTITPTAGYNDGTKALNTHIPYKTGSGELIINVLKDNTSNAEIIEQGFILAGYYPNNTDVKVVVKEGETDIKLINVQTNKDALQAGPITPDNGYDYLKQVTVVEGSSKVQAQVAGNVVKLTPTTEKGWIEETEITGASKNLDGSYYIALPVNSAEDSKATIAAKDIDNDNKAEVVVNIPEGYYDGSTSIPVVIKTGDSEKTVEFVTGLPDLNITSDDVELIVPAGFYPNTLVNNLGKSKLTLNTTEVSGAETQTIGSQITYVSTNKGYTKGEAKKLVIANSATPVLTSTRVSDPETGDIYDKVIVNIAKGGWAEGETDVSASFANLADLYSNGFVDRSNGQDATSEVSTDGLVLFTYASNLDEVTGGVQIKVPTSGNRYFTSAKVDLSALIMNIDNI